MKLIRRVLQREFPFVFSAPALLWQVYFVCLPLLILFDYSITAVVNGRVVITFEHYRSLLTHTYFLITLNSFMLALTTAFLCLCIGYPIAYFLAVKVQRFKTPLLVFLILPSWTSFIVQIYAWFFLLSRQGFISRFLYHYGITSSPIHLLNTYHATVIGMVYCYLPFMIFPLYACLERMDRELLQASADLGANRWQTFKRVVVPFSRPGIAAGLCLVFIPAFGEFAIPDLMGGNKYDFVGSVVVTKFIEYGDWYSGSAFVFLSVVLPFCSMAFVYYVYQSLRAWRLTQQRAQMHQRKKGLYG